jgi:hypothetical protein
MPASPARPTEAPAENRGTLRHLDLSAVTAGNVVEIVTAHSTFWFTILKNCKRTTTRLMGVSITTDSTTFGQIVRSPSSVTVDRYVVVGQEVQIGTSGGHTSEVSAIRVLR